MKSQAFICAKCEVAWPAARKVCTVCGSASRKLAPPTDVDPRFRWWLREEARVHGCSTYFLGGLLIQWLIRLPGRVRRYRRGAGLWPNDRD